MDKDLMQESAELRSAKKKAMRLLEYADRTEKTLRERLKEGEFSPLVIDEAIAYVKKFKYLDDRRFAENYIISKGKKRGLRRISYELKEMGVSEDVISQLIEESEFNEEDAITELFLKKYRNADLSDSKIYEKAFRYFMGKGYSYDSIKSGIRKGIEQMEE